MSMMRSCNFYVTKGRGNPNPYLAKRGGYINLAHVSILVATEVDYQGSKVSCTEAQMQDGNVHLLEGTPGEYVEAEE